MSLYNVINGVNQFTFLVLPMLDKHPDEYPKFRDCFVKDESRPDLDNHIHVYTRTGGGNREGYIEENKKMTDHPNFVTDFDDDFDSTFASWIFSIPEKWKNDFNLLQKGEIRSISKEYKEQIMKVFPKLKETLTALFQKEN